MVLALVLVGLIIPFRVCIVDSDEIGWYILDILFDIIFSVDLLVNFFSAFYD